MGQYIKINGEWKHVVGVYKKLNGSWTKQEQYSFDNNIYLYDPTVIDHDVLTIVGNNSYTGRHFYVIARCNDRQVEANWAITSGSTYASINPYGRITIKSAADNNQITVTATYGHLTETKTITVTYDNQLTIECADTLIGTSGNAIAMYNDSVVEATWSITSGSSYATIANDGSITILDDGEVTISATYNSSTVSKTITVQYDAGQSSSTSVDPSTGAITHSETVTTVDPSTGATTETSTSTTMNADGTSSETTSETVTNLDGSSTTSSTTVHSNGQVEEANYTTSSPDSDGSVTTVETYVLTRPDGSSYETESTVVENEDGSSQSQYSTVSYDENGDVASSMETEVNVSAPDENGTVTTETSTSILNADGTSSESTVTEVENEDGSATAQSQTIRYDENGDVTGSTTGSTTVNVDGSSASTTTNYNSEGDPTDQQNVGVDTTGNISTQDVEFVDNGGSNLEPLVTGYEIDTTRSEGEGKEIEGDGVNTQFIPFKFASEGFVLHMVFKTVAQDQPRPPITEDTEDTGSNYLYTIIGAKTSYKVGNVWPGFEIRWVIPKSNPDYSDTSKVQLQFCSTLDGETSTTRTGFTTGHDGSNVYDITVTYNPNTTNKFIVRNNVTQANIQSKTKSLQSDVNLDMTIGYSTDHNNTAIRHANVTVYEFSVQRLSNS